MASEFKITVTEQAKGVHNIMYMNEIWTLL